MVDVLGSVVRYDGEVILRKDLVSRLPVVNGVGVVAVFDIVLLGESEKRPRTVVRTVESD
jgi:hypothetical protein